MNQVLQPFHSEKFNFTKVKPEEVIFRFQETENDSAQYFDGAPPTVSASPSSILINVSVFPSLILLLPRLDWKLIYRFCILSHRWAQSGTVMCFWSLKSRNAYHKGLIKRASYWPCTSQGRQRIHSSELAITVWVPLQQSITSTSKLVQISLIISVLCSPLTNITCQAYYLKVQYPVEKAPTEKITVVWNGLRISQLVQYPVSGFVFEGGAKLEDLSQVVSNACIFLQENNRPFNVLISESGKRVFLLLQVQYCKCNLGFICELELDCRLNIYLPPFDRRTSATLRSRLPGRRARNFSTWESTRQSGSSAAIWFWRGGRTMRKHLRQHYAGFWLKRPCLEQSSRRWRGASWSSWPVPVLKSRDETNSEVLISNVGCAKLFQICCQLSVQHGPEGLYDESSVCSI